MSEAIVIIDNTCVGKTNANGHYTFWVTSLKEYEVTIYHPQYATFVTDVRVFANDTVVQSFTVLPKTTSTFDSTVA